MTRQPRPTRPPRPVHVAASQLAEGSHAQRREYAPPDPIRPFPPSIIVPSRAPSQDQERRGPEVPRLWGALRPFAACGECEPATPAPGAEPQASSASGGPFSGARVPCRLSITLNVCRNTTRLSTHGTAGSLPSRSAVRDGSEGDGVTLFPRQVAIALIQGGVTELFPFQPRPLGTGPGMVRGSWQATGHPVRPGGQ